MKSIAPSYDDGAFDTRMGSDRQDRQTFEPIEEPRFTRRAGQ